MIGAMTIRRSLLPLAAVLLPLVPTGALAGDLEGQLSVVLRCVTCTAEHHPSVGILWPGAETPGVKEPPTGSIEALDWTAGRFMVATPAGRNEMTGVPLADGAGWRIDVPLGAQAQPFRLVASLEGFAADRAAFWPGRDVGPHVVELRPIEDVLQANPTWDPAKTGECDVLVPKSAPVPVTFVVEGQPRAWLHPAEPAADGTPRWDFRFVRPGETLLERLGTTVSAFDEGGDWSFRLPLESLLAGGAVWPTRPDAPAPEPAAPAAEIRIVGGGMIRLDDCPRQAR